MAQHPARRWHGHQVRRQHVDTLKMKNQEAGLNLDHVLAPDRAGIAGSTRTARRVVVAAFAATALLVAALMVERFVLHRASDAAVKDVKAALSTADAVTLYDERLTMSAHLAAATGERRWIDRYEADIPLIDKAIAAATALAPASAAARFDAATRVANDKLVAMERQAFALIANDQLAAAQAVLASAAYAKQKEVLATGSDALMTELQAAVDQRLLDLVATSWLLVGAVLVLSALLFALLWRSLQRSLKRAEMAFAAKQSEVTRLALHDPLTGLANRRYLHMQLEGCIARAAREQGSFALLVLDLDGFKPINDRHGHGAGDAVLIEISRRLNAHVRKGDIAARLGGDEFVLVLNQSPTSEVPARAATRLIAALSEPIVLPQGEVRVSASVGVAFYPADAPLPDDLIRKADVALYRAKNEARGEVRFFQATMDDDVRQRESLELDLRTAIAASHIEPYFQPLIDLEQGGLIGFEVLARWPHPTRGMVPPAEFVPIAEDSGQIDALTVCVMRAALLAARHWDARLTIAINIAPQQLKNESLIERLLDVLRETGFPPERFEVEITENALIGDLDMARRIVLGLKSHGIRVALDDFGTGYSSLSHLSELPFDKIKIDRSFIHTMRDRHESATIVNAIIGLGRSLNLPTTAEGIETPADAEMLSKLGCNVGQGFLYSKAVPAGEVAGLVARYALAEAVA
jgi:diguanylate cyclase (GGDEF)-like protein